MEIKDYQEKMDKLEVELEELSMHLADMLGVALHFAGVPQDKIPQAAEAYLNAMDEVYGEEDDGEMGFNEMVSVINHLKDKNGELFS